MSVQYADYAIWQERNLGSIGDPESPLGRQMAYWREKLRELPVVTDLPMDRARPAVFDSVGDLVTLTIDDAVADRIDALCRAYQLTPFMVGYGALAVTISRLASTADTVVASPTAGRTSSAALNDLVGMFVNTLVLRSDTKPGKSVDELLREVRNDVLDAFDNSQVQFDDLLEVLAPPRSSSYSPLAQIAFTYTDDSASGGPASVAGLTAEPITPDGYEAKFDLTVLAHGRSGPDPMTVDFLYSTALFDAGTVDGFAQAYNRVLEAMTNRQDIAIGDIDLVGDDTSTVAPSPAPRSRPVGIGGAVESGTLPDILRNRDLDMYHPALICNGVELTYAEFEARTDRVARALLQRGVAPDDVVAIALERSIESVVAVWGVVKSGAAYLPVDTAYPADRIAYMLTDSRARFGITGSDHDPNPAGTCEWFDVHELESPATPDGPIADGERNGSVRLTNLAYLIYTSGSTGRPKAVGVNHTGISDFAAGMVAITGSREDNPDTRILHVSSPSFDASVFEMVWAITAGHTLVIASQTQYAGDALGEVLDRDEVTDMIITPSVLASLDPAFGETVRNLATGGEACPPQLVERWAARGRRLFNFYGPTETTVWATKARMMPGKPITLGRAIGGFTARVLDARLHPVPQGVTGELYLSTRGVARGYLGKPGLTATAFVADPFSGESGARMYATGDLVRLTASGDLEFAGRADHQVKINGQRVELGEIESVLAEEPGVTQALVVGHSEADSPGRMRLVGYLVVPDGEVDADAVLTRARDRLAAHMVPSQLLVIRDLPLTPGGKLDRDKLPAPDAPGEDGNYVAPTSTDEEKLATIVAGLLGRERVSVTDPFFALGGDSIMSIQLASAAKAAGLVLSPREIFEHQTVRAMAQIAGAGAARLPLVEELAGGGRGEIALPPMVSWMIDGAQGPEDIADFNQSAVLFAGEDVNLEGLTAVVEALVAAHPMLSARLVRAESGWQLTAGVEVDAAALVSEDACDAEPGSPEFDDALRAAHAAAAGRLDPATGALVHVVLVKGAAGAGRIVVVIHHLGVDTVSWPIIVEDLLTAWAQLSAGQPLQLRPEATTERSWFAALAARAAVFDDETDYWLARSPQLPTPIGTSPRSAPRFADTAEQTHRIESSLAQRLLTSVPEAFDGAVTDVLLAALGRAVRSWQRDAGIADENPVTLLVESHGRYEEILEGGSDPRTADLSRTVGWFTSIAPLALDPSADMIHAVKAAKEERLGQPRHGQGFGVLRNVTGSELARRPLPSIAFNYLGGRGTSVEATAATNLVPASDAPPLPAFTRGHLRQAGVLAINAQVVPGDGGPEIVSWWRLPADPDMASAVADIASRWRAELADVADAIDAADPGLSPSDVPGSSVTQDDLDDLAERFGGAEIWPLSPLQQGLLFQSELVDEAAVDVYVTQATLGLVGEVDIERLRRAADGLLDHHSALRSAFVSTASGAQVAVVPQAVDVPWRVVDLPAGVDVAGAVAEIAVAERLSGFDLEAPPLIRLVLVRHDAGASLVVTNHHILFDGWSGPLVLADLLALYATGQTYTGDSGADFGDHVRRLAAADHDAALVAWRTVLAPVSEPTLVATKFEVTAQSLPQDHPTELPAELAAGLERRAQELGVTTATVFQFAWAVLVSRLTGNQVVSFGETVSGRPADLDGVESTVGLFINTLPAVVDVDPAKTVEDVLTTMQADKVAVLDYQHIGLPELAALAGQPALFDTLTVFESYPVDPDSLASDEATEASASAGGLQVAGFESLDATHYPLNMAVAPHENGLRLTLKYLPGAFDAVTVSGFADALVAVLAAVTADPTQAVGDVPIVGDAQARDLLPVRGVAASPPRTLAEMCALAAQRAPQRPAVRDGESSLTYAEIDARSNQLARWLRERGVGGGSLVAVALERSADLLVAIWAIAKAGGAYMPIDPDYPVERIAAMVKDSGVRLGLVGAGVSGLPDGAWWQRIDADFRTELASVDDRAFSRDEAGPVRLDDLAYVIYTSGSTGRPKGVAVTHRGLRAFADAESASMNGVDGAVVLGFASPSFDASILELLLATVNAGTVVYRPADVVGGEPLAEFVRDRGITHVFLTPPVLATIEPSSLAGLTGLGAGGEAVSQALVEAWAPMVPIVNMYGPSEATVAVAMTHPLGGGEPVHLGGPIPGTGLMVLDARLHPVPVGMNGELYVSGAALARGYLNRPDLTSERFVADPFSGNGSRMYRTGDVVRWGHGADGQLVLEYSGRSDDQIKLRGLRIELGEIEAVLNSYAGVESAVVVGVGGSVASALAGYVVADESLDVDKLREHARLRLPSFMVPSTITVLDALPLTPVGKLDKQALPAPVAAAAEYVAPGNEAEEAVARVFAEVLGTERVSVAESFFDAGGNSLSAMRLVARVGQVLDVELSVRDLFTAPSVRELVAIAADGAPGLPPVVAVVPRPDRIPLSFAQQRMWFINQFSPGDATYNIPAALRVSGDLDVAALRAAVIDVTARHEVLRTVFPDLDGVPVQVISPAETVDERLDDVWQVVDTRAALEAAVTTGFDVTSEWPMRVRLWPVSEHEHVLAVVAHHIAADGESLLPLVTDLVTAYAARAAGAVPEFEPLAVQFADYAIWQHEVLGSPGDPGSILGGQLTYWKQQLAGVPDVLELPADRPRPAVASHRGVYAGFDVPATVAERVEALAREHGVTPFMVAHAVFTVLLARLSATDDIVVGTPIAGRGQEVLDRMIGQFANTLVLRTRVDPGESFVQLLGRVRSEDLDAFAHSAVPFEALVEAVDPVRSEAFSPLVQVIFSFDPGASASQADIEVAGLSLTPVEPIERTAQLDLDVTLMTGGGGTGWSGSITGAADMFDVVTVESMGGRYVALLDALTADPGVAVGDASWMSVAERQAALAGAAGPARVRPRVTLADAFAEQVARIPDAEALVFEGRSVSYGEFGARVAVLARELIAAGVGPDVPVGVCIDRSVEMLVAVQAVLAAGGQYVPVDITAPADRAEYMLTTAGVTLVLVAAGRPVPDPIAAMGDRVSVRTVDAGGEVDPGTRMVSAGERRGVLRPDNAAYTLFTSGSTGRPKGVTVSHAAVGNFLAWFDELNEQEQRQRLLFKTPYTFDASVLELFWPTVYGQTMVIAEPGAHRDPESLAGLMVRQRVSVVQFVPSLLSVFLDTVSGAQAFASVQRVFCGGEALPPAVYQRLVERVPGLSVTNLFGPTECAVYTESAALTGDLTTVPIGQPMPNTSALVLDGRLRPVPLGVAGELYLGGPQVARGYAAQSVLTAERFVADPFGEPGARLYRTGDRVRWNGAGELEYLGRTDFQVKLRGQRIELGEIEAVLASAEGVVHAAAAVAVGHAGEQLVGYVAPASVDLDVVKAVTAAELPGYMVPSVWMPVEQIALNNAGKIDRKALPEPVFSDHTADYVAPVTEAEEAVAAAFAEVLGVDRVGATESFFDIGGNSLAAVRVRAHLAAAGREAELAWLFSDATPRALARRITGGGQSVGDVLLPLRTEGARAPLFAVHPAGGLAWFYGGLAPYLTDRPIYGLQDPHVAAGEESVFDANELAARYVDEIRRVQPDGPYHLLGWSIGGYIAQTMATLLQESGAAVGFVGIMDSLVPDPDAPAAESVEPDTGDGIDLDAAVDVLGGWRDLFDIDESITAGNDEEVLAVIREQIAGMGLLAEDQVERIMESFDSSADVLASFRPRAFDGDLYVYTATADKPDPGIVAESWRRYFSGTIHNIDVDTHHLGMANTDSLSVIGPAIDAALMNMEDPRRE